MDMPDRIGEPVFLILPRISLQEGEIIVDRARNDVEVEPLCRRWLLIHEKRQAFRTRIGEPVIDRQAIAPGLRNLLSLLVEEYFVIEALGLRPSERADNLAGELH